MPHAIWHAEAVGGEIAEPATVVATAGSDQAGGGQETAPLKKRSPGRRIVAIIVFISCDVAWLQAVGFNVAQNARPELYAIAQSQRIRVRRALVGTREHVQAAENYFCSAGTIPVGQFIGAPREGQMH